MIACSVGFFLFPYYFYNVVRAGVDPLIARITQVVPLVSQAGGGLLP
jgi:NADH-quinone oxidoreductase subunit M